MPWERQVEVTCIWRPFNSGVSECGLWAAASTLPGNQLEKQMLGASQDRDHCTTKPGGGSQKSISTSLSDNLAAHSNLRTTVLKDCSLSKDLSHFPNRSGCVAAPMLRENQSISVLFTDAKPFPPKDTPMNLLPDSDDLLIFNALHLASRLPLWDQMCWTLQARRQRSGWISVRFWVDWEAAAAVGKENQAAWAPCCFCLEAKFPHTPHGSFRERGCSFQNLASPGRGTMSLHCSSHLLSWFRPCPFGRFWVGVWLSFWRDRGNEQVCENLRMATP